MKKRKKGIGPYNLTTVIHVRIGQRGEKSKPNGSFVCQTRIVTNNAIGLAKANAHRDSFPVRLNVGNFNIPKVAGRIIFFIRTHFVCCRGLILNEKS